MAETTGINAVSFAPGGRPGADGGEPQADNLPVDTAWAVLEAANDLGDDAAVKACRRVIDANLNGSPAVPSDLHVVLHYFG